MTMMELLTIPGMDGSKKLMRMYKDSRAQMRKTVKAQRVAAAVMSRAGQKTK